jgi:hypothetical protein
MATIVHTDWLNGMLGSPTHSVIDFDTDDIDASLLDATDANGGVALTAGNVVDYADVNQTDVVATTNVAVSGVSGGIVSLSGAITFASVTGDAADYLTVWKNTGTPSTSPLAITWDSASTGLPVTPNGGDINVTWASNQLVTLS